MAGGSSKPKVALKSADVLKLVKAAMAQGAMDFAALMAISRLYLLRVPSEGIPLEWDGRHSKVEVHGTSATITLMRRKNTVLPTAMTRECCCSTSGWKLCAVHWLVRLRKECDGKGCVFSFSKHQFTTSMRAFAVQQNIANCDKVTSHGFRRGMGGMA